MPTYDYVCLTNDHRFEVKQSFSDDALTECIEFGEPVRKVFSAAGIVFKGSGYYVTDTRSSGSSSSTSGTASSGSSDSSSKDSSSSKSSSSSKDSSSSSSTSSSSSSSD